MHRKTLAIAAILAAAVPGYASAADLPVKAVKAAAPAPFFFVNENSISYSYETKATDPGQGYTPKHVMNFTHFDVWAYGTNFFTVDWLKATSSATPSGPCPVAGQGTNTCEPYHEIYGLFRSTLGFNQLSGTKMFSMGPLTNVSLLVGADLNTDNTFFASAKRSIEAGLQFDFAMPYKGFFNLGVVAYKEWQHNGYQAAFNPTNPGGKMDFDTTWRIEMLYVQPLGFLPPSIPLTYKFLGGIQGPKGAGTQIGAPKTATEYRLQQTLALDIGQMAWTRPNMVSVWVSYRYWKNKFGVDPVASGLGFTRESQFIFGTTVAF